MSASIPFAVFHEMSLKPLRMETHSQMICTGSGGLAKARISVISCLWRVSRAARAFSRSGRACRSASSASSCSTVICLRFCSTSVDFSVASFFFLMTLSVARAMKGGKAEGRRNEKCESSSGRASESLTVVNISENTIAFGSRFRGISLRLFDFDSQEIDLR
jgi:hypothetical protein